MGQRATDELKDIVQDVLYYVDCRYGRQLRITQDYGDYLRLIGVAALECEHLFRSERRV